MCGIVAVMRRGGDTPSTATVREMRALVAHRGPDGSGEVFLGWDRQGTLAPCAPASADWTIALGHQRLAILDVSPSAAQPMSRDDWLWTVYNGEIYNYVELRTELRQRGHRFTTESDTEVLLAAYAEWGTECFARLRGMWGAGIVDGRRNVAVLSRDRLGIKPLYYARGESFVAVASEIKQLSVIPDVRLRPQRDALVDYLATGYEDSARTFFEGVEPVPAASWLTIELRDGKLSPPTRCWAPEDVRPVVHDRVEAGEMFASVMRESVALHLRSDVPVGFALSGGLDSSAVAAWASKSGAASVRGLQAFSASFPGHAIDETKHARLVASHLGLTAHVVEPTPNALQQDLDRFVWQHDEPVGSLSQYAGYAVARLTRAASVPVTLNGQGGDEILAGYWQSYFVYLRGLLRNGHSGSFVTSVLGALLPGGNRALWRQVPTMLRRYRQRRGATQQNGVSSRAREKLVHLMAMDDRTRRVYEITEMYLPRLLKWDDRNFMAFSVEGRYPFLDHKVIETALSFAPEMLYRRGWVKEPLRQAMAGVLPSAIVRRRDKLGFETPQVAWLQNELRPLVRDFVEGDSPLWQYADPTALRALASRAWSRGGDEEGTQTLVRYFMADRWLRKFFG